ncbi:glutathione S-transferase family protein [Aliiroseovarius sp.]|uniref:glutathione S-transferase family protein n=1 Tax=Aliiroseovarius sp. TaxID=1872442 RepID=UPI00261FB6C0|nr:glutathione S-transferase family protein [Aliiroseovarius sp.]
MIKVISFTICPFVQRVTALLEAKQLSYQVEFISLSNKPGWFLDISPNGQVPVLVTEGGVALFESDAIVEYLEEAYPPLIPGLAPEQKAQDRAWAYLATKNYLVQCGAQRSADLTTLKERGARLGTAFDKIEAALADRPGPFFAGDTPGLVDLAWLVLLHRAAIIEARSGYDFIGGARPRVKAWQAALMGTGLAEASVAPEFDAAFTGFYLSDQTYLGRGCDADSDCADQACGSGGCC